MSISIFAKPCFLGEDRSTSSGPYLFRVSSRIRGEEMAEYLEAKYNPIDGCENDLCIYVKPRVLDGIKDGSYVDVLDGDHSVVLLQNRPKIKVIAMSESHYGFLREKLKNEVFLIHHHHCNFERILRCRKEITTGGYIGPPTALVCSVSNEIKKRLEAIGLKFITCFNYKKRQDIIDYYKQIDFQVIGLFGHLDSHSPFTHPTKVINAASFGIPTICNRKVGYKEFDGNYIPVQDMDSLVVEVEKMKDKNYYDEWANKIIKEAEKYHISKIAEKYRQLV